MVNKACTNSPSYTAIYLHSVEQIKNIHFGTQCVPNRKQAIELTHRPKITDSKALSKLNSQLFR